MSDEPSAQPLSYFDFEFEQFSLDSKILKDLVLDEIMLYNNPNAVKYYKLCKQKYPNGVLEILYKRNDTVPATSSSNFTQSSNIS